MRALGFKSAGNTLTQEGFKQLIENKNNLSPKEILELEEVLKSFPYFNQAHLLLAKAHHDKGSMFALQRVRRASVYAPNRGQFCDFVEQQTTSKSTPKPEPQFVVKAQLQSFSPSQLSTDQTSNIRIHPVEPVMLSAQTLQTFLENQDKDHLIDEIQESLQSFVAAKKAFEEQSFTSEKQIFFDDSDTNDNKKKTTKYSNLNHQDTQKRKIYIHTPSFGKDVKSVSDAVSEYLKYREDTTTIAVDQEAQQEIIRKFLTEKADTAKIIPTDNAPKTDLSKRSTILEIEILTESYANMLIKQHKKDKAIEVFEKLSLKYPDKSTYFASRIEDLRNS